MKEKRRQSRRANLRCRCFICICQYDLFLQSYQLRCCIFVLFHRFSHWCIDICGVANGVVDTVVLCCIVRTVWQFGELNSGGQVARIIYQGAIQSEEVAHEACIEYGSVLTIAERIIYWSFGSRVTPAKSSRSHSPFTVLLSTFLYTHFYPQKNHSIIHIPNVSCWFPMEKRMKLCLFKYSHRAFIFLSLTSWFRGGFPVWRFAFSAPPSVHRSCECFEIQSFTPKTTENQDETRSMWRRWMLFWGNKYVYTCT